MLFSQRKGITPAIKEIQIETIDDQLRNRLWNLLKIFIWDNFKSYWSGDEVHKSNLQPLLIAYWHSFFKLPVDTIPSHFREVLDFLRKQFYAFSWYRVYDFLEFTLDKWSQDNEVEGFLVLCNQVLEEENAAYRIIKNQIVPVTSGQEIQSIEEVLSSSDNFYGVNKHISTALEYLSDREKPDYRNSIKESISAVESICQKMTGDEKATLGKALTLLENRTKMHPAFKGGLSKLYGYTSDEDGIRHAILEEREITFSDAKFMLITCSAFINYVIGKIAELGLVLPLK
jgi:hypothetical protein